MNYGNISTAPLFICRVSPFHLALCSSFSHVHWPVSFSCILFIVKNYRLLELTYAIRMIERPQWFKPVSYMSFLCVHTSTSKNTWIVVENHAYCYYLLENKDKPMATMPRFFRCLSKQTKPRFYQQRIKLYKTMETDMIVFFHGLELSNLCFLFYFVHLYIFLCTYLWELQKILLFQLLMLIFLINLIF